MKALIRAPFWPGALERLRKKLDVTYESWMDANKLLSAEEFIERIQGEDIGIVVVEADFVTREIFERATKLKFLGLCRADAVYIDVKAATERGGRGEPAQPVPGASGARRLDRRSRVGRYPGPHERKLVRAGRPA